MSGKWPKSLRYMHPGTSKKCCYQVLVLFCPLLAAVVSRGSTLPTTILTNKCEISHINLFFLNNNFCLLTQIQSFFFFFINMHACQYFVYFHVAWACVLVIAVTGACDCLQRASAKWCWHVVFTARSRWHRCLSCAGLLQALSRPQKHNVLLRKDKMMCYLDVLLYNRCCPDVIHSCFPLNHRLVGENRS